MPFNDNLPAENTDPWYTTFVTAWNNLKTFVNGLETSLGNKVNSSTYTAGMALKADLVGGVVPTAQLPPLAINDTFTVASQAAMLALTAERGDVAIRTDNSTTYILAAEPASTLANWKAFLSPGTVVSVAGKTGVVALVKGDVGLGNVDNTSDANKPVSTAQAAAIAAKVAGLNGTTGLWQGTAVAYAAIVTKDPNVVYIVKD